MMNIDPSWDQILSLLESRSELPATFAHWAMTEILEGNTEIEIIKSFLLAMKSKGETSSEVSALVDAMYAKAQLIEIPDRAVDIVGTGGDGLNTITFPPLPRSLLQQQVREQLNMEIGPRPQNLEQQIYYRN